MILDQLPDGAIIYNTKPTTKTSEEHKVNPRAEYVKAQLDIKYINTTFKAMFKAYTQPMSSNTDIS